MAAAATELAAPPRVQARRRPIEPMRLIGILLWILLLSGVALRFAQPPWDDADVARSGGMVLSFATWGEEDAPGQPVTLPHTFGRGERAEMIRVYRIPVRLDPGLAGHPRLGLCIPRWSLSGDVWIDGLRLASAREGVEALKDWVRPQHIALPPGLSPGPHEIKVRLRSSPAFSGGMAHVWLGDDAVVGPACEAFAQRKREFPGGLSAALLVTGVLAAIVAVRLRDAAAFWFAVTAFAWSGHHLFVTAWSLPLDDHQWTLGWMLSRPAFVPPLVLFCLRFFGLRMPRFERGLAAVTGCGVVLLLLLPESQWWRWIAGAAVIGVLLITGLMLMSVRHAAGRRELPDDMLMASLVFLCITHLLDLARWLNWLPYDFLSLSYVSAPMVMGAFSMALVERIVTLYRQERDNSRRLATEVAAQRAALETSYRELRHQRDAVVEAQERQRIMRELHDGLGSHLVAAATLLAGPVPRPEELAELVERSLHELRNALDALASDAHDLAELLGALRDRVEPVLDSKGMRLDWHVEELPATRAMLAAERLHVLRIVQEAFTNILKHSGARHVELRAGPLPDGRSLVAILDDGRGLGQEAPPGGRGLTSMRDRARRLRAELIVEDRQQGLRVELRLPAAPGR